MSVGRLVDLPRDRCVAAGSGAAIVALVDGEVVAFENRCLHQESPLAGGMIRDGVLTCPLHFWRYRLPEGAVVGTPDATLKPYAVEVVDGVVWVEVPDPEPEVSMREQLLQHAREWKRDEH